jgi:hypothetical protein
MDVVKIKCGNSFSEIEVKGHQAVLTVFHTVKTKKAKLQYFLSFFSKFQFFPYSAYILSKTGYLFGVPSF